MAMGLSIPLIEVNHMQAHILAHFAQKKDKELKKTPAFPFLCLTVSGGHTQLVLVKDIFDMEVIGTTIDDAAGEAFDKAAKILNLPYPGGPLIDKYAKEGNASRFSFAKPKVPDFDYSFSGLKTSILYFVRDEAAKNENFVSKNLHDLCASIQKTVCDILVDKLIKAAEKHNIKEIAIAGGVSANSGLRNRLKEISAEKNWNLYIPDFEFCTDNAAMIAVVGYYKFLKKDFSGLDVTPLSRFPIA